MHGDAVTWKQLGHFFFSDYGLTIVMRHGLASRFSDKYKVQGLFIAFMPTTEIQLSVQGLRNIMGKPIRNACLLTMKHDCISIV